LEVELDLTDSNSLTWNESPQNYIIDIDEGDQITVVADLGAAANIFAFDGEYLTVKLLTLEEFSTAVNTFFSPELTTSITFTASDLAGDSATLYV
jgi:hypothetical protein